MKVEDGREVGSWLKTLLMLALALPMTAYVAVSFVSTGAAEPADRGPVIIENPAVPSPDRPRRAQREPADDVEGDNRAGRGVTTVPPAPPRTSAPSPTPTPSVQADAVPQDHDSARVLLPSSPLVEETDTDPQDGRDEDGADTDNGDDEDRSDDHDVRGDDGDRDSEDDSDESRGDD